MSSKIMDDVCRVAATRGYGFAAFRSHSYALRGGGRSWLSPGVTMERAESEKGVRCQCGQGYIVSSNYHWHSLDGSCHNKVRCILTDRKESRK